MKKICFVLAVVILCVSCPLLSHAQSYWEIRSEYVSALDSGDNAKIIAAVKKLENLYWSPSTVDDYDRLATPLEKAALAYEKQEMFSEAKEYYQKAYKAYSWLNDHGRTYRDKLMCLSALINHLDGHFEVYTATSAPINYPDYDAVCEPEIGTLTGYCDVSSAVQSAQLIYVQYLSNDISDFAWKIPADPNVKTLEIAWNVKNETLQDLRDVAADKNYEYMKRNIDYLSSLDYNILLRFGAEVNCWVDLSNHTKAENTKAFIDAFRKIADYAHNNSNNIAMVFSPNDISHWDYDFDDFYPGDKYVDWVGFSSYNNIKSNANGAIGNQSDAWYAIGHYENQIERIRPIIERYGSRKPIMVSECGFCYKSTNSTQTLQHALDSLNFFYNYISMVYPQVKAVFYFNTDFGGNSYSLKDEIESAYIAAVTNNANMNSTVSETKAVYTKLNNLNDTADHLTLYSYNSYPVKSTVKYILDGKEVLKTTKAPYRCDISALSVGVHTLKVSITAGKTTVEKNFGVYVGADGSISTLASNMKDLDPKKWYYEPVAYCLHNSLFNGVSSDTFAPNSVMTRAMLVTVLYRMSGSTEPSSATNPFKDVRSKDYFYAPVLWAYENGIVNGMSADTFAPNDTVIREQVAAILFRYSQYSGGPVTGRADISGRSDYEKIRSYARDAMSWASYYKIIDGDEHGRMLPRDGATRAQLAKILYVYNTLDK